MSTPTRFVLGGEGQNSYFGTFLSPAGDVNGDGFDDAFVSAPNTDSRGSVLLVFGDPGTGLTTSGAIEYWDPEGGWTQFGYTIASRGRTWKAAALFAVAPLSSRQRAILRMQ